MFFARIIRPTPIYMSKYWTEYTNSINDVAKAFYKDIDVDKFLF